MTETTGIETGVTGEAAAEQDLIFALGERQVLRFTVDGDIYHEGRLIKNAVKHVYKGLITWLTAQEKVFPYIQAEMKRRDDEIARLRSENDMLAYRATQYADALTAAGIELPVAIAPIEDAPAAETDDGSQNYGCQGAAGSTGIAGSDDAPVSACECACETCDCTTVMEDAPADAPVGTPTECGSGDL